MKKTVVILALALGFSISNLNATNEVEISNFENVAVKPVEISPLCKAVATGDMDVVKNFIEAGADLNVKSNGMMPLHYAAKYNRVDMIKVLITAGAKVHSTCDKGLTPLNHAKRANAKDAEMFLKRFKRTDV